jgi:hypothetical protein
MRNLMSAKRQIISSGCPAAFHFSIHAAADVLLYFNFGLSRLAYGCFQANSGILVYQEEKSLSSKKQMDRLHARDQPAQSADFYSLPDHSGDQITFLSQPAA